VNKKMNSTALLFALGTVLCWGVYSVLLHLGSVEMGKGLTGPPDLTGNRMKAFLLVGIAYVLVAIVAPVIVMMTRGTSWNFPTKGWSWSLVAGLAGAVGAFFLLMALSSGRSMAESKFVLPLIVPAIVFAGAPIVNTLVATAKEDYWQYVNWKFVAGILLAAAGTAMVMKYKPAPPENAASFNAPAIPGTTKTGLPLSRPEPVAFARPERSVAPGYKDVTKGSYFVS
jgi:drug/metabolite transporter (DMT)-like permease